MYSPRVSRNRNRNKNRSRNININRDGQRQMNMLIDEIIIETLRMTIKKYDELRIHLIQLEQINSSEVENVDQIMWNQCASVTAYLS